MIATPKILSGASQSNAIQLDFETPLTVVMPAAWTAAKLSFLASFDGVTYGMLSYEGTEVSYTVAAGDFVTLDPFKFSRVPFLKLRSGVAATPVNQAADRTFTVLASPDAI
jgi:hypothetical protein